uniref:Uncharacterized protein n=1 Tax=Anguilla anguilla TaxID=7936 RepID=A0A0E9WWG7_ANGAN
MISESNFGVLEQNELTATNAIFPTRTTELFLQLDLKQLFQCESDYVVLESANHPNNFF